MSSDLRQATASQSRAIGPFIDDTDFKTTKTGLTIANTDIKLIVNGAASANKNSGGGTHRANGVYGVTFDATDTASVGEIEVSVVVSGALPVFHVFNVLDPAAYDNKYALSTDGPVPSLGIVDQGTAQSASGTGVVIRAAASFADNVLIGNIIGAYGSTQGYWQYRSITGNALSGDTVTVDTWAVTPSGTITYKIFAGSPASATALPPVNVTQWNGTAVASPATAGIPEVNVKNINNVAAATPGASGGVLISGSNSGTTTLGALTITGATTHTGNMVLSDGLTISAPSTTNRAGVTVTGNGSGAGIAMTGGSTGNGMTITGGASGHGLACAGTGTTKHGIHATGGSITSHGINALGGGVGHGILATSGSGATGDGIRATAASTNGNAFNLIGVGTGSGLLATGGATGHGISGVGGATSGNGLRATGTAGNSVAINAIGQGSAAGILATGGATGHGISGVGGATSGNGMRLTGTAGNSQGLYAVGQGSAAGLRADGGATGAGASFVGGGTSGNSIDQSVTSGNAYVAANAAYAGGTAWGSGAITAASIATDAITAAKIAADSIGASELAADAVAEIADAVLEELVADHSGTSGSTAEALAAAAANSATIMDQTDQLDFAATSGFLKVDVEAVLDATTLDNADRFTGLT